MHRWSQLFIPTLREAPADAEVTSHKLLLRAGYIRQLGAGIYSYLFLATRSIHKISTIVREEMNTIGQEFLLPALSPREIWDESGRWASMGDNMFRLKDRKGADLCLGMTHEEVMTSIARNELRSYKQLPQIWYQIQTKFRDEPRPKSGLLRVRQFLMKDSYSFDIDEAGLDESYAKHDRVYRRIFNRCGLEFVAVDADSGAMGGSHSQEFMVYTDAGEDLIASSPSGYAANLEKATSVLIPVEDLAPTGDGLPELIHTPNRRTIDEVASFLNQNHSFELSSRPDPERAKRVEGEVEGPAVLQTWHQIKTMAYMAEFKTSDKSMSRLPIVVFLRGDHNVNETKLASKVLANEIRPMTAEEIERYFSAPAGYLGPIGLAARRQAVTGEENYSAFVEEMLKRDPASEEITVILDKALEGRSNLIAGANRADHHFRNVTPGRDFTPTVTADIRNVLEGELDPIGQQPLRLGKAVEIGHIFKLGYKYSKALGASVLNRDGKETTPIMGSYGIGVERILTAAIESSAAQRAATPNPGAKGDTLSYALPPSIAPFEVVVTVTNITEPALLAAGEQIAADLSRAGIDTLLDDRDERAGVKFKDADLIGIPYRINVGKKLAEGKVELVDRLRNETSDLTLDDVALALQARLSQQKQISAPPA